MLTRSSLSWRLKSLTKCRIGHNSALKRQQSSAKKITLFYHMQLKHHLVESQCLESHWCSSFEIQPLVPDGGSRSCFIATAYAYGLVLSARPSMDLYAARANAAVTVIAAPKTPTPVTATVAAAGKTTHIESLKGFHPSFFMELSKSLVLLCIRRDIKFTYSL